MDNIKPGEKMELYCATCERFRQGVFDYGPLPIEEAQPVPDVLRATCPTCGGVIALAPESTPAVRHALGDRRRKTKTTIRVQSELAQAVGAELSKIGADPLDYDLIIKGVVLYALSSRRNWRTACAALRELDVPVMRRPVESSITLRLTPRTWDIVDELEDDTNLSTSELIRRILVLVAYEAARRTSARKSSAMPIAAEVRRLAAVS